MTRKAKLAALAAAGAITVGGSGIALAANSAPPTGNYPPIVQRLSQRFHLNQAEVQQVFDQQHQEHHQQMQNRLNLALDQAVKDGKLTADQKAKLLEKMQQLWQERQNMTPEQRQQSRDDMHDELEKWAEDNGIDLDGVLPIEDEGHHHRHSR